MCLLLLDLFINISKMLTKKASTEDALKCIEQPWKPGRVERNGDSIALAPVACAWHANNKFGTLKRSRARNPLKVLLSLSMYTQNRDKTAGRSRKSRF